MSMKFSDETPLFSRPMLPFKSFLSGEQSLYSNDLSKLNLLTKHKQEPELKSSILKSISSFAIASSK